MPTPMDYAAQVGQKGLAQRVEPDRSEAQEQEEREGSPRPNNGDYKVLCVTKPCGAPTVHLIVGVNVAE